MDIKTIYDALSSNEQKQLMYALQNGLSDFIKLADNKFIGVNTQAVPFLIPVTTNGRWAVGTIKEAKT